ncbi:unnamed protein product [Chilo suppressalis]|uniref:Uncharacterized protein n=1 Tax=Chilo suppressalis TaxID=168631 RepID=A0ABN8L8E5_CHISP|nr:unnamed protein product [Chilo suppressalis]
MHNWYTLFLLIVLVAGKPKQESNLGEKCYGPCCNSLSNASLQCWHGVCQPCLDANGNWSCRDTVDQFLLVTTTQLIMAIALVLGIIATLMLLLKLCSVPHLRSLGISRSNGDRQSVSSLQMYVDERLRDAPPRYSRTSQNNVSDVTTNAAAATTTLSPVVYTNNCFVPDDSIPPPPYTEVIKNECNHNASVHM